MITKDGREQEWSGIFEGYNDATKWYRRHGKPVETNGRKLIMRRVRIQ